MLAIAGMGCRFPGLADLNALTGAVRQGVQSSPREMSSRGSPIERYEEAICAAACAAIDEAGLPPDARVTIFLVADDALPFLEPSARHVFDGVAKCMGRTIAPKLGEQGRGSAFSSLRRASCALMREEIDAALILAASVLAFDGSAGAPAGLAAAEYSLASSRSSPPPPSEGAAAIVLTRHNEALRPWAFISSISEENVSGAVALEASFRRTLGAAGWQTSDVSLVQVAGLRATAIAEATAVSRLYPDGPRETALCGARAFVGDCGVAADLTGVILGALCAHLGWLPCVPGWRGPAPVTLRDNPALFVASQSQMWFRGPDASTRRAAVFLSDSAARIGVLALEAPSHHASPARTALAEGAPILLPLAGADRVELEARLDELILSADAGESLSAISAGAMRSAAAGRRAPLGLAIVAANPAELRRETGFMKRALEKGFATGKTVRTPNGSAFAPSPLGPKAKIAFAYPGNGSAYVGAGREILMAFSGLVSAAEPALKWRLPVLMRANLICPRAIAELDADGLTQAESALNADAVSLPLVGMAFSTVHTRLLKDVLGITPSIAFGYSVGEIAMRVALGQWNDWDELEPKLKAQCLVSGLTGEMTAVRAYFDAQGKATTAGSQVWQGHVVKASAAQVEDAIRDIPFVFISAINAPEEVVIAGDPQACRAALEKLKALSMPLGFDVAIHAPPAEIEHEGLGRLGDNDLSPVPGIDFFSAHGLKPVPQSRSAVAASIGKMLAARVDFCALTESVYASGARVFIETGVRNNCTNWISATLGAKPHLAVAMDVKGLPSDVAWMRAAAQLFTNRVTLDFGKFLESKPQLKAGVPKTLESAYP